MQIREFHESSKSSVKDALNLKSEISKAQGITGRKDSDDLDDKSVDDSYCGYDDSVARISKKGNRKRGKQSSNVERSKPDLCQFCKKYWLSKTDVALLSKVLGYRDGLKDSDDSKLQSESLKLHNNPISGMPSTLREFSNIPCEISTKDLRDLMIVCDSCEGVFHVLCMGMKLLRN